jgi:type II secretory pathway component PulF
VLNDIRSSLEDGNPFGDALAEHPKYFDTVYRSLVSAGEGGGGLPGMLDRLASLTRRQLAIKQQLVGSMTYPAALLLISGCVLGAMFAFVLPRFAGLFETLQAPLPPSTELMLVLSGAVRGYWWAMLIGVIGGAVGVTVYVRSPSGKEAFVRGLLRLPIIGKLMRDFTLARIARVLGTLLQSAVPFLEALELTRAGVNNPAYVKLLEQAEQAVVDGEPVSAPFGRSQLISPAFAEAMRSGEESGRLGTVLSALAEHLDEDNEVKLRAVTKIIEPVILSLLGVMVGAVAVSLFLPLFDLTAMTQGGS